MSRGHPSRSAASWLLAGVAMVALAAGLGALWAKRELLDAGRFSGHAVTVLRDPEVQVVTADYLADQVVAQGQATGRLEEALKVVPGLPELSVAGLHALAEQTALAALRQRALEPLWAQAIEDSHAQFTRWLEGRGATRRGSVVELDLQPLTARLARSIGVPDELVAEATAATGGAQVRVIRAGQYERTRSDVHRLEAASGLLLPLAGLAAIASLLVAPRRRWAAARLGAAATIAGGVVLLGSASLGDRLIRGLTADGADPSVAAAIWASTHPALTELATVAVAAGLAVTVVALLTAPRRQGPATREPAPTRAEALRRRDEG